MACPSVALSVEEILQQLTALPDWQYKENALERVYKAHSYVEGLERLNAIAQLSEAAEHHPDLLLGWCKLTIRYWTHTVQGVTALDFNLAHRVEKALTK